MSERPRTPEQIAAAAGLEIAYLANEAFNAWKRNEFHVDTAGTAAIAGVAIPTPAPGNDNKGGYEKEFRTLVETADSPQYIGVDGRGSAELIPVKQTPEYITQKITHAKRALAEKYKDYGVRLEQFKTIQLEGRLIVVYIGGGIDLGRPSKSEDSRRSGKIIMADPADPQYKIESGVPGHMLDTREGMTFGVAKAMFDRSEDKKIAGKLILLCGEKPTTSDENYVPVAKSMDGCIYKSMTHKSYSGKSLLFIPSVVVLSSVRIDIDSFTDIKP